MADDARTGKAPEGPGDMARLRENRERYGAGYAVMSEVLGGDGMGRVTKLVGYGIVGVAGVVVLLAIWTSMTG